MHFERENRDKLWMKDIIVKLMTPEAEKKKVEAEKKTAAVKGLKQQVKKATKEATSSSKETKQAFNLMDEFEKLAGNEENIPKLQAILDKFKKIEPVMPAPKVTKTPSRKEIYRNGTRVYIYTDEHGVEVNSDGSSLVR